MYNIPREGLFSPSDSGESRGSINPTKFPPDILEKLCSSNSPTGIPEAVDQLRREGKISTAGNSTGHREEKSYRFDLLPYEGLRAAAETFAYGENKYGRLKQDPTQANWKGLDITTHQSPLSHAMEHIAMHITGDRSEDHLGHAMANVMMQCWFERNPGSKYFELTYPEILAGRTRKLNHCDEILSVGTSAESPIEHVETLYRER